VPYRPIARAATGVTSRLRMVSGSISSPTRSVENPRTPSSHSGSPKNIA
jgi:hypothetical protein